MPKYNETHDLLTKYKTKWVGTAGLNIDTEIEALQAGAPGAWDG